MVSDWEKKRAERFLGRRYGQTTEERARVKLFNDAQSDWTATCRICGAVLTGTPAQLKAHTHGEQSQHQPQSAS